MCNIKKCEHASITHAALRRAAAAIKNSHAAALFTV